MRDLTSIRSEGGSGRREGQPGKPNPSKISGFTNGDLDGEFSSLKIGGADRNLHSIGRNIETVDEGPDDRFVLFSKG